jgi:SAM-dependent methyltransferase
MCVVRRFASGGCVHGGEDGAVAVAVSVPVDEQSMTKRIDVAVSEGYARWSVDYDSRKNPLIAVEEAPVRALLGDLDGRVVLDAGCGTGRHAIWMREKGAHVIGVDESAAMLAVARAKAPDLDLREGSLLALDFAPGTFDIVLNALMAEHVDDLGALFARFARVLGARGALVMSVFHPFMVLRGVPTHYDDDRTGTAYVMPTRSHLPSAYVRHLRDAGFRLDEMQEPVVDDALVAGHPQMAKYAGWPLALILRATRR